MNSPAKMLEMQMKIRENASELTDYLRDLDSWENEIKKQDQTFTKMKPKQEPKLVAPVRGSSASKKKFEKQQDKEKPKRIKSYDFKSWDKLDVDKMMKDIDAKEAEEKKKKQEEIEKNLKQLAVDEKNQGNQHFKGGRFEKAVECYSKGMQYDGTNPLLPANRAMAYLKLKQYVESEADCTLALSHDPGYVKAYLRRGSARVALGKVESAIRDFSDALKLEPDNTQAKQELESIKNKTNVKESGDNDFLKVKPKKKGIVLPINKPFHLRSKKPLKRIEVFEINQNDAKVDSDMQNDVTINHLNQTPSTNKQASTKATPMIEEVNGSCDRLSKTNLDGKQNHGRSFENTLALDIKTEVPLHIPPPAKTCFQFQADVRKLHANMNALYQYLLQFDTSNISTLLKDQLDTDLLMMTVRCFNEHASPDSNFVIKFLTNLTKAQRFDMAVMFLSKPDKQVLESLKQKLTDESRAENFNATSLFQKYNL